MKRAPVGGLPRRRMLGNATGQMVMLAIGLASGILLARTLGPGDRGRYVLLVALCSLVTFGTDRGASNALMTLLGRQASLRSGRTMRGLTVTRRRVVETLLGCLLAWLLFALLGHSRPDVRILGLEVVICVSGSASRFAVAGLMGSERFLEANICRNGILIVHLAILLTLFSFMGFSLLQAFSSLAVANVVCALLAVLLIAARGKPAVSSRAFKAVKADFFELTRANRISSLQLIETFQLDLLMLGAVGTASQVGLYSVANSVISAIRPIGQALGQPVHVALAGLQRGVPSVPRKRMMVLAMAALLLIAAMSVFAHFAVPIIYGPRFAAASLPAAIGAMAGSVGAAKLFGYEAARGLGLAAWTSRAEQWGFVTMVACAYPLTAAFGPTGAAVLVLVSNACALALLALGLRSRSLADQAS